MIKKCSKGGICLVKCENTLSKPIKIKAASSVERALAHPRLSGHGAVEVYTN